MKVLFVSIFSPADTKMLVGMMKKDFSIGEVDILDRVETLEEFWRIEKSAGDYDLVILPQGWSAKKDDFSGFELSTRIKKRDLAKTIVYGFQPETYDPYYNLLKNIMQENRFDAYTCIEKDIKLTKYFFSLIIKDLIK